MRLRARRVSSRVAEAEEAVEVGTPPLPTTEDAAAAAAGAAELEEMVGAWLADVGATDIISPGYNREAVDAVEAQLLNEERDEAPFTVI